MYPSKKTKSSSIPAKPHHDDQICPPRPRRCRTRKAPADEIPRSALSVTSPAAAVAAAYHGVREAMPLDLLTYGRSLIVFFLFVYFWYCCRQPTTTPRPFPAIAFFQQQNARGVPRDFALPNNPPGRVHTAGGRTAYRENVQTYFPSFPITPTSAFPRLAAADAAAAAAVVAECTHLRRAT